MENSNSEVEQLSWDLSGVSTKIENKPLEIESMVITVTNQKLEREEKS